jgi:taurine dioxygenase
MEFVALSPALGVEVVGLPSLEAVDADDAAALAAAFDAASLLLFRNLELDDAAHMRLAGMFGPLVDDLADGHFVGLISNVEGDRGAGAGPLPFHSDLSWTSSPVLSISLYATALPSGGTSTFFASGARAWETLPDAQRARVAGLRVRHAFPMSLHRGDVTARDVKVGADEPRAVHPLVMKQPRTGASILYLTELHAEGVEGLAPAESDPLLDELLAHLYAPQHVYEHHWRLGDLVVWDNLALQHARVDATGVGPRTFRRTSANHHRLLDLLPTFEPVV